MIPVGQILADIPEQLPEELFTTLASVAGVRIERIVSRGHSSAPDFWYQQDEHEWIILLSGGAVLRWENDAEQALAPGDYVMIPAGTRHRVEGTLADENTIWLAVFIPPAVRA
ncbi:cupin domain-containing protein [Gilvimarinus sp. SDUM040013]|uniref:Cupin domain-containing protein n=1 Tax=Gilvimarinus gilvus TaxID=3058038 RepID=A0ABU4S1E3_9GAMM|nr:cupin domain-containing protein [Gilvimarinus sp. SDUM040013]MDO3384404.1 cupin domain-containing protein [Gilvimarinus sp. SDUM040013]MDX6851009.1 cupin domain-containing protein [Gilvimarinus sp. SDUM040013]